jgi:hypothetical protein
MSWRVNSVVAVSMAGLQGLQGLLLGRGEGPEAERLAGWAAGEARLQERG